MKSDIMYMFSVGNGNKFFLNSAVRDPSLFEGNDRKRVALYYLPRGIPADYHTFADRLRKSTETVDEIKRLKP